MKQGDKVRFLNSVGGGIIAGFDGRDIVIVTDEDGFDIPTLRSDVVVIDTNEKNIPKAALNKDQAAYGLSMPQKTEDEDIDPADLPITFRKPVVERTEGDTIQLYWAFVPRDIRSLSTTSFDLFLVNDTNYNLQYVYSTTSTKQTLYTLQATGSIAPNTKECVAHITHSDLDDIAHTHVQLLAYKAHKTYLAKAPLDITLRIDGSRFYKLHAFRPSVFFDTPALVYDLIHEHVAVAPNNQTVQTIQSAFRSVPKAEKKESQNIQKKEKTSPKDKSEILEIDLHAAALLDDIRTLQPVDILSYQIKVLTDTMTQHRKDKGRKIVFIHGKGEGVLRKAVITTLRTRFPRCSYQDASFQEYGYGATMVTIH